MRGVRLLVLAAALPGAAGCFWTTTKSEGQALRRDVDSLDKRIAGKEADLSGKIAELKAVLDDATKLLKRNSADLGADVDGLRDDIRKATGLVAAMQGDVNELKAAGARRDERLTALEGRLAAIEAQAATAAAAPTSPDDMWTLGESAFKAGRLDEAKDLWKRLAQSYPGHARADDALYFRGEIFARQTDHENAIREYQKVFDKYADSPLADDALFRAGDAAFALKQCTEARAYYGVLKQKYPKSELKKLADDKDKTIKAAAKNRAKCDA